MTTAGRYKLRDYQSKCLEQAKRENTIVHLGTGRGKTLVAHRLIEEYLNTYINSKALILVPAVLLVEQHALSCRHQIDIGSPRRPPRVLEIVGSDQSGWNREDWERGLADHDIFIATPDTFRKALINHKYISVDAFSVMVFDECHHATKAGSMATILHDGVHPFYDRGGNLPRLLGLTASFTKGKLDNAVKERQELEALFRGTMVSPEVGQEMQQISELMPVEIRYGIEEHNTDEQVKIIQDLLSQALQDVGQVKDFGKAINASVLVFDELGRESLIYYVEHAIVKQIETKIARMMGMNEEGPTRKAEKMSRYLPTLRKAVDELKTQLVHNLRGCQTPPRTPKLDRLLELLQQRFFEHRNDGFRGVIFVKEIALVPTLAKQINDFLESIKCGVVAGGNAQSMSERKDNMDAFRRGDSRVLVATAALEEGVHVAECQFAILFSKYATTKSIIQILGRVRHKEAEHYFFENDPGTEMRKAERVVAFARDTTLSLTEEERKKANMAISWSAIDRHPYPFTASDREQEGTVNLINCKEIFVDYCSRVLGRSVNPRTELYGIGIAGLTAVRYPSPESWMEISQANVEAFWEPVDVESLFSSSRTKNLSGYDKIERRFVYVVVIMLREAGYLTISNKPSKEAMARSKQNCPLRQSDTSSYGITLKRTLTFNDNDRAELKRTVTSDDKSRVELDSATFDDNDRAELDAAAFDDNERPERKRTVTANDDGSAELDAATFDDNGRTELGAATVNNLSFANALAILKNFVEVVLERNINNIEDLFEYSTPDQLMPTHMRFPTPGGWKIITYHDVDAVFEDMSLGDQLDSDSHDIEKTHREKMELGMAYLAVLELHAVGHLDDDYQPGLTSSAMTNTQKNCPFISIPTAEDDMSVAQVSEMSLSAAIRSGPDAFEATNNENEDMEIISDSESTFSMISHHASISVATADVCGDSQFDDADSGQFDDADCDVFF